MRYHAASPTIKATTRREPRMPPAIAPASELLCEVKDAVPGVSVDWGMADVNMGKLEAVPVTSGES